MKKIKNILGVFLVAIAFGLCIPNNVTAEEVNTEEVMSEDFKSYLNEDGKIEIKASFPKNEVDFKFKIAAYLIGHILEQNIGFDNYSEDFKTIDLILNPDQENQEIHTVDIEYVYDEELDTKINEIITEEKKTEAEFGISDLDMIHHYYYKNKYYTIDIDMGGLKANLLDTYSTVLKSIADNKNINLRSFFISGDEPTGLTSQQLAGISWYEYNDTIYTTYDRIGLIDVHHIFYVPTDTKDNAETIRNVAQKRINDYLHNEKVKLSPIENVSTVEDYLRNEISENENITDYLENYYNISGVSKDDYIYKVEMEIEEDSTVTFDMIVKRDSDKMINSFKSSDLMSGIEVSANTPIALDTLISVSKLTSGTEYEKIMKLLGLTDSVTYDIKLFSKLEDKYITKLEDGTFEVKIPIPENLKGKDLTVYYVNEDGKVEEYEVTIKDGYAIFNTNHFSIYTLGDTKDISTMNEKNPETGDNILLYIVTSIMSLICLAGIGTHIYKKTSKEVR